MYIVDNTIARRTISDGRGGTDGSARGRGAGGPPGRLGTSLRHSRPTRREGVVFWRARACACLSVAHQQQRIRLANADVVDS
eukprot:SAG31_NODE_536_length_14340_cov_9.449196_7_plen_82_part_00